nr:hypothetical protein Iba_chr04dCG14270 [Ipomoea batatas]
MRIFKILLSCAALPELGADAGIEDALTLCASREVIAASGLLMCSVYRGLANSRVLAVWAGREYPEEQGWRETFANKVDEHEEIEKSKPVTYSYAQREDKAKGEERVWGKY